MELLVFVVNAARGTLLLHGGDDDAKFVDPVIIIASDGAIRGVTSGGAISRGAVTNHADDRHESHEAQSHHSHHRSRGTLCLCLLDTSEADLSDVTGVFEFHFHDVFLCVCNVHFRWMLVNRVHIVQLYGEDIGGK